MPRSPIGECGSGSSPSTRGTGTWSGTDVRGLGESTPAEAPYSDAADLLALLDHLGLRTAVVVGCSNGGRIALDTALIDPTRIRGLALVASGLGGLTAGTAPEDLALFAETERRYEPILTAFRSGDRARAREMLKDLWCSAQSGESLALVRQMMDDNIEEIFTDRSASFSRAIDPPAAGRLGDLRVPTLLLEGTNDAPDMTVIFGRLARGIPHAHRARIDGADHLINLSRPVEFDRALHGFLVGLESPPA